MPQVIIYLDREEDERIMFLSGKWKISKHEAIKKIVREFIEIERRENNNANIQKK